MAIIIRAPGSGGLKKELLWSNPNPTSVISSSITINFDYTQYDIVFVQLKGHTNYGENARRLVQVTKDDKWLGLHVPGDSFSVYRNMTVTDTGITFGTTAGYAYHNGGNATGSNFCIPTAIYGVKGKIEE